MLGSTLDIHNVTSGTIEEIHDTLIYGATVGLVMGIEVFLIIHPLCKVNQILNMVKNQVFMICNMIWETSHLERCG